MNQSPTDPASMTVSQLIGALHAGRVTVDQVPLEQRQEAVAHLTAEGLASNEIARVLGICERTVRRDRAEVRRAGAIKPAVVLGDELLGELHRLVLAAVQRTRRLARDPDASIDERLRAEQGIVRMYRQFVEIALRMNYLDDGRNRIHDDKVRRLFGDTWFEDFSQATGTAE